MACIRVTGLEHNKKSAIYLKILSDLLSEIISATVVSLKQCREVINVPDRSLEDEFRHFKKISCCICCSFYP